MLITAAGWRVPLVVPAVQTSRAAVTMPRVKRHLSLLLAVALLLVAVPATASGGQGRSAGSQARAAGYWCGSTVVRGYRFPVRVERGRASCHTARWIMRWWLGSPRGQHRKGWWCFNDHGSALSRGGVAHCSKSRGGRLLAAVRAYQPRSAE